MPSPYDRPSGALDRVAALVLGHRAVTVSLVVATAVALASAIGGLRSDPSPDGLVQTYDGHEGVAAAMAERFGDSSRVLVVLVEAEGADDALSPAPLGYLHALDRQFRHAPYVRDARSVTSLPLPRDEAVDVGAGPTLDELAEDDRDHVPIEVLDAVGALVRAEPERFAGGALEVQDRLASLGGEPLSDRPSIDARDAASLRRAIDGSPVVGGLISDDRRVAALVLELDGQDYDPLVEAVEKVDAWIDAHPAPDGVRVSLGGLPAIHRSLVSGMESDRALLLPATLLVCGILLFLSYRWWPGVALPLVTVSLTVVMVVGAMAWVGEPMTVLGNVVPPLLIVVGVSDSIHLINRYREEIRARHGRLGAARRTFSAMAVACFSTSLTTAAGLASLAVSHTEMLRRFGVLAALGVLLAYVVTLAFLPPTLTVFAPPKSARGEGRLERALDRMTRGLVARPWRVIGAIAVAAVGAVVLATQVRVDTSLRDQLDDDSGVARATRILDDRLEGSRPLEILVTSDVEGRLRDPSVLRAVDEIALWAAAQPEVLGVTSPSTVLHEAWALAAGDDAVREQPFRSREQVDALDVLASRSPDASLRSFLAEDGAALRLQVRLADAGAQRSAALIDRLDRRLDAALAGEPNVHFGMTGEAYVGSLAVASVVDDLLGSLLLAVFVIFGLLALLFRDLRLALASIPPNALPLILALAWMVARDVPLDVATAIIFSIGLGLSVDGTIHVLVRFREERARGGPIEAALTRSAAGTGRAVVVSCVTLALGFGVLTLSDLVPVRRLGELIAVIAVGCLGSTMLLLPPLLAVLLRARPKRASHAAPGRWVGER